MILNKQMSSSRRCLTSWLGRNWKMERVLQSPRLLRRMEMQQWWRSKKKLFRSLTRARYQMKMRRKKFTMISKSHSLTASLAKRWRGARGRWSGTIGGLKRG